MQRFMINVEVESDFVEERSGISAKGKDYEIRSQKAWAFLGSKFPKEITLNLDKGQRAFAPGLYQCDLLPALDVGDFGRLVVDGRKLSLLAQLAGAAAKAG